MHLRRHIPEIVNLYNNRGHVNNRENVGTLEEFHANNSPIRLGTQNVPSTRSSNCNSSFSNRMSVYSTDNSSRRTLDRQVQGRTPPTQNSSRAGTPSSGQSQRYPGREQYNQDEHFSNEIIPPTPPNSMGGIN